MAAGRAGGSPQGLPGPPGGQGWVGPSPQPALPCGNPQEGLCLSRWVVFKVSLPGLARALALSISLAPLPG